MCGVKTSIVQAALTKSRAESKTLIKNTLSDNNIQKIISQVGNCKKTYLCQGEPGSCACTSTGKVIKFLDIDNTRMKINK